MRDIVGYVCSVFSAIPYRYWAQSHHFHHNHNGMLEVRDIGDLDTLTVKEYAALSRIKDFGTGVPITVCNVWYHSNLLCTYTQ